ncbi:isopentenyl-diphosphate delta-isomerase [Cryobacterium sp. CG_9.6]|nr:isopentenyl-diphosphate delta-isomerase [Cryobacterium sp. CG_9.6]
MAKVTDVEEVVLLSTDGQPIGVAPKATVHDTQTPLHLAFSCHVLNDAGEVLVTRRALSKRAWPGVWTNSFCGHPQPGESSMSAVSRRADFELGLTLADLTLSLPDFRYRAVDASGVVENEICPVYLATAASPIRAHPDEVMDHAWVDAAKLGESIRLSPWAFSPWLVLQAQELPLLGGVPVSREDVLR